MKCPLYKAWTLNTKRGDAIENNEVECDKEDCGWWSPELNRCDPTGLAPWLKKLTEELERTRGAG